MSKPSDNTDTFAYFRGNIVNMVLPREITINGRAQDGDTFRRSSEFETLDRILYLTVNVKIFSLMDSIYHYF